MKEQKYSFCRLQLPLFKLLEHLGGGARSLEVSNKVLTVLGLLESSENHLGALLKKEIRR
jgi:hypothetical protein